MLPDWFHQLGIIGWPLACCSVLTITIFMERTVFYFMSILRRGRTYKILSEHLTEHQFLAKETRDELVGIMLTELHRSYFSGTRLLRVIGTISPILSLLGTILGIISAFKVIAIQTGPVSPSMIADGLWETMLTTAAGLMIALPALLLSHLFHNLAERQLNDFCLRLNKLSMSFEIDATKPQIDIFRDNIERLSA